MADFILSKRMNTIVELVDKRRVADIGCDHAFISMALIERKLADYVVAMDVREGPLAAARRNISASGYGSVISTRLSDGFQALHRHEVSCAVIAGMGGGLMVNILKRAAIHISDGISLVLQPQSDIVMVRKYLYTVGYVINCERMLAEDGKYYTVMRAVPSDGKVEPYTEAELRYGRLLLASGDAVLCEYLDMLHKKNEIIIDKLRRAGTETAAHRMAELMYEQKMIKDCIG